MPETLKRSADLEDDGSHKRTKTSDATLNLLNTSTREGSPTESVETVEDVLTGRQTVSDTTTNGAIVGRAFGTLPKNAFPLRGVGVAATIGADELDKRIATGEETVANTIILDAVSEKEDKGNDLSTVQQPAIVDEYKVRELDPVNWDVTSYDSNEQPTEFPYCRIADVIPKNQEKAQRMIALSAECAGLNMTALYQADPKNFASEPPWPGNTGLRVINKASKDVASFCMVGRVTHCTLKTNGGISRELCLQPLERFAPRMATVLGRVLSYNSPMFVTKAYGLSFSTKINTGSPPKLPKRIPLNGVTHGPVLRSPGIDVPIFDGREPFSMDHYIKLHDIDYDLDVGDWAAVVFTVGGYKDKVNDQTRVSLNIQFAVLLGHKELKDRMGGGEKISSKLLDDTPQGVSDATRMGNIEGEEVEQQIVLPPARRVI